MMDVYSLHVDIRSGKFQSLSLVNFERDMKMSHLFKGQSLRESWEPIQVRLIKDPRARLGHLVYLEGETCPVLVFTSEGVEKLRDLLESCGELLPLASDDGEFFAYTVTAVIDALDGDASKLRRFSDGAISQLNRPAFKANLIDKPIFMIPQIYIPRFVTGKFAQRVKDEGLEGFELTPCEVR